MSYGTTLSRVETYFDKTATRTWERLTSDAPVSRIRETVRQGRDAMRDQILGRLPADLTGVRVLDAGCGAGQMTQALAARGAHVVAVDISPSLVEIARKRLSPDLAARVTFHAGDMLDPALGRFDHAVAMDSLIYYDSTDVAGALKALGARTQSRIVFTVAPRTRLLMAMWRMGQLFPRSDRSPTMVPQSPTRLATTLRDAGCPGHLRELERVSSGFYISQAMEYASC
ncbi:magnesium protoporphyrin IX methyltransferase [Maritimibacter sp. UBA3975]|uniref:magnesium protoporphyrin IX methyltransferase n=1 Tax=Maritimibacter sp. UBA3975 TaxID=1946833 RepID=UPI000C0A4D9A|nr:magnesium protoporphyrin IX methyltransferase [Maritimibacter sp. UBA3975]MAM62910.1 magnesium protoporphyrin IX methyltransferase [Maritimibacter sp.]|tara:strand:- start:12471 stop:13154 length:684 start_codon:yes stop_codon:yes gene_type:complete